MSETSQFAANCRFCNASLQCLTSSVSSPQIQLLNSSKSGCWEPCKFSPLADKCFLRLETVTSNKVLPSRLSSGCHPMFFDRNANHRHCSPIALTLVFASLQNRPSQGWRSVQLPKVEQAMRGVHQYSLRCRNDRHRREEMRCQHSRRFLSDLPLMQRVVLEEGAARWCRQQELV